MRAVDTNVLVRLLTRDDAKQAAAAEVFIDPLEAIVRRRVDRGHEVRVVDYLRVYGAGTKL